MEQSASGGLARCVTEQGGAAGRGPAALLAQLHKRLCAALSTQQHTCSFSDSPTGSAWQAASDSLAPAPTPQQLAWPLDIARHHSCSLSSSGGTTTTSTTDLPGSQPDGAAWHASDTTSHPSCTASDSIRGQLQSAAARLRLRQRSASGSGSGVASAAALHARHAPMKSDGSFSGSTKHRRAHGGASRLSSSFSAVADQLLADIAAASCRQLPAQQAQPRGVQALLDVLHARQAALEAQDVALQQELCAGCQWHAGQWQPPADDEASDVWMQAQAQEPSCSSGASSDSEQAEPAHASAGADVAANLAATLEVKALLQRVAEAVSPEFSAGMRARIVQQLRGAAASARSAGGGFDPVSSLRRMLPELRCAVTQACQLRHTAATTPAPRTPSPEPAAVDAALAAALPVGDPVVVAAALPAGGDSGSTSMLLTASLVEAALSAAATHARQQGTACVPAAPEACPWAGDDSDTLDIDVEALLQAELEAALSAKLRLGRLAGCGAQ